MTAPAALLGVVLAVSACAGGDSPQGGGDPPKPTAPAASAAAAVAAPAEAVTAPKAPKVPEKAYPPPAVLLGLDGDQVARLLGPPRFRRQDAPAEIWQYRTPACALDVFLYREDAGGAYRVRHIETRNRNGETLGRAECFVAVIKAHEKRGTGQAS